MTAIQNITGVERMKQARFEIFTPKRCAEILENNNINNRNMRGWWAEAMAQAMRRGEWITSHQGIAFTEDGDLLDGQHRLYAVLLADRPVEFLAVYGLPKAAFGVIDIGIKRSIADSTGLDKKCAEAARLAALKTFGGTIMPDMVAQVARCGFAEIHSRLLEYCGTSRAVYSSAPMRLAACLLVMDGYSEAGIFQIYRRLLLQHFGDMNPIEHSFVRQISERKMTAMKPSDLMARALKVLNPANGAITRIQVSDAEASATNQYCRELIQRAMHYAAEAAE